MVTVITEIYINNYHKLISTFQKSRFNEHINKSSVTKTNLKKCVKKKGFLISHYDAQKCTTHLIKKGLTHYDE